MGSHKVGHDWSDLAAVPAVLRSNLYEWEPCLSWEGDGSPNSAQCHLVVSLHQTALLRDLWPRRSSWTKGQNLLGMICNKVQWRLTHMDILSGFWGLASFSWHCSGLHRRTTWWICVSFLDCVAFFLYVNQNLLLKFPVILPLFLLANKEGNKMKGFILKWEFMLLESA